MDFPEVAVKFPKDHKIIRTFAYTPSGATNIRKSFAKENRRLAEKAEKEEAIKAEALAKTIRIRK